MSRLHNKLSQKWFKFPKKESDVIIDTFRSIGYEVEKQKNGVYNFKKDLGSMAVSNLDVIASMKMQKTFSNEDIVNTIKELFLKHR
jgi:hypothetical protein